MKVLLCIFALALFAGLAITEDCYGHLASTCTTTKCGNYKTICDDGTCTCDTNSVQCDTVAVCNSQNKTCPGHHEPPDHHHPKRLAGPHDHGHHHDAGKQWHCIDNYCSCTELE